MRVGIITSGFPYTAKETFLEPELRELSTAADLTLYPVNPRLLAPRVPLDAISVRMPVISAPLLGDALLEIVERPIRVARALCALVFCGGTPAARLKNVVVFPKALAVARDMRRRRIEHVHAYWASTPASVAHVVSLLDDIPWSFTAHRWDIYEDNALRRKAHDAAFVRSISERGRASLASRVRGPDSAKIEMLHLGVDVPPTAAPRGLRLNAPPFTLLCAANLERVKGHAILIDALRLAITRGTAIRCDLAGDGSLRDSIADRIRQAGLERNVIMRGAVAHETLLADLASGAYDAAVLASIEAPGGLHEGIPVFLMEAMAAGVPCIATRSGSIGELIDGRCGILVEQQDPGALAQAIARLVHDAKLRQELAQAAQAKICAAFATEDLVRRFFALIQRNASAAMRCEMSATTLARS